MKISNKLLSLIFAVILIYSSSCSKLNDPILFSNDKAFVAFPSNNTVIKEGSTPQTYGIPVMVAAVEGSPSVTVNFDFDTAGLSNPAVEGVDFTLLNVSKTLTYANGWGYDTIWVKTIPNGHFTGDKNFNIVLKDNNQSYKNGADSLLAVKISDNEHPLGIVLGSYSVSALSYFHGQTTLNITTSPIDNNYTQIQFKVMDLIPGAGFTASEFVLADIDTAHKTFRIQAGQAFPTHGYGPSKITGFVGAAGDPQIADGDYITGTFDQNGTITLNDWIGLEFTSGTNAGLFFDLYESGMVWTKSKGNVIMNLSDNQTVHQLYKYTK